MNTYCTKMTYYVKEEYTYKFIEAWKNHLTLDIENQEGFINVFLYKESEEKIAAYGIWKDKSFAIDFMKKTDFKAFLDEFSVFFIKPPFNKTINLEVIKLKD